MEKQTFKYLFGPVPSRRLGISLGVDLVPHKVCSLNCIYCECGATTHLTIRRDEYVPTDDVINEIDVYLSQRPVLDYITFSGSGEPTLHSRLGEIASHLKTSFPDYKVALLTNGTLFTQSSLVLEVQPIDLIIPSLDAVSEDIFKKINRPARFLKSADIIQGLINLRRGYRGQIWLEIFIVPGINDTDAEIDKFNEAIECIDPNKIQLNSLDRPGTESWVRSVTQDWMETIATKFNRDIEIVSRFQARDTIDSYNVDIQESIIKLLKRRPCTVQDLSSVTGLHENEVNKYIEVLLNRGKLETERLDRGLFFKIANE